MANGNLFKHWPTVLLGLAVAAILLVAVFSFQLDQTDTAVVTTFGRPAEITEPGLHWRWPFPFQRVYKFDRRVRSFAGGAGRLEETITKDNHNIIIGIYVDYSISNAEQFFRTFEDMTRAEDTLNSWMRSAKKTAIGQYNFSQLVNTDPQKMCLEAIQNQIASELADKASGYGLKIIRVGINAINVPTDVSAKVFERMIAERKLIADRYLAEGGSEAKKIRIAADRERTIRLADAEAKAKEIRAEGDAEAAKSYAVFQQNPELAEFLRKLDSLRQIVRGRTTLVLDTNTAPFDLLKSGAEQLTPVQK